MTRTNICNFFKILKSKCSLFAADRCKTVGTKQETWSESKTMMSFDENSVFLANFCSKNKNSHSSKTKSDLSPVFLNVDFPARWLQPIIGSKHWSYRSRSITVQWAWWFVRNPPCFWLQLLDWTEIGVLSPDIIELNDHNTGATRSQCSLDISTFKAQITIVPDVYLRVFAR